MSPAIVREYTRYLRDVAKIGAPPYLDALLHSLLRKEGTELVQPSNRENLHPFLIPLAKDTETNVLTGLLRWPTPPDNMEIPVVQTQQNDLSLTLLSPSSKAHLTRAIASADFAADKDTAAELRAASSLALAYQDGDADASGLGLERFLLIKVGPFPDLYEGLAQYHRAKGDDQSALISCERAAQMHPGWGRAHAFHAGVLKDMGRENESRDAARFCLQMPLWTIGHRDDVAKMGSFSGYKDDTSLGKIYRRLYEDKREGEIVEGKAPQQVALDRAAYLLDVCVAEGWDNWETAKDPLAGLYDEAGLHDVATFIRY